MTFEEVEDAIIERLKERINYLRSCETYAGQIEGNIDTLVINYPAAFVSYGGSEFEWLDEINVSEAAEFNVMVCARNQRGQAAVRKEGQGCYQMIADVLRALTNQRLGLEIELLHPARVELVYISKTMAIYNINFQTSFDNTYA